MNEPLSKSQKKRDAESLQQLGIQFIELSDTQLKALALPEPLYQAIVAARTLKKGALKRQRQFIGKLMRSLDSQAILAASANITTKPEEIPAATFHTLEQWRERLLKGEKNTLTEFINTYPHIDKQQLRHLLQKAIAAQDNEQYSSASKELFRFLRSRLQ